MSQSSRVLKGLAPRFGAGVPVQERERVSRLAGQIFTPLFLIAVGILAYKFWA